MDNFNGVVCYYSPAKTNVEQEAHVHLSQFDWLRLKYLIEDLCEDTSYFIIESKNFQIYKHFEVKLEVRETQSRQ